MATVQAERVQNPINTLNVNMAGLTPPLIGQ